MVRQVCCDVADGGEAIESFFPDRNFAGDILTAYYTDYEPESSFVAVSEGKVVAYINGCLDNRRYGLVMLFLIMPRVMMKGLVRGVFWRVEFWQILKATLKNWRRLISWRQESFHSHQGHMHIGVSKLFRHQRVGEQLVHTFLKYVKEHKTQHVTASVHESNTAACRFFERLGFVPQERHPMVMAYGNSFKGYYSILYVKTMV